LLRYVWHSKGSNWDMFYIALISFEMKFIM